MKLFRCDENIKTYKFPAIKIVLCSLLVVLLISRNYLIHINNSLWKTIIDIVCFQVVILSILCIYLSIGEMILLKERKKEDKINIEKARTYSKTHHVDYILSLLEENDIIEISGLEMNSSDHSCRLYGESIAFTPTEFKILWLLCENRGKVISSEELFEKVLDVFD